jgi:proteasome alpha subunit
LSRGREYDGAITIFSPEGRIYQVEYALELVKRGAPVVGVNCPEGIVLAAYEIENSKLEYKMNSKKIFKIDEHVGVAVAGLSPDARVLIRQARLYSQGNLMTYGEPIEIEDLTSAVGDLLQRYTQNAGVRPFGVSLIFGGIDSEKRSLLTTDPSGSYRGYKATAIGRNSEKAKQVLREHYHDEMTIDAAIAMAIEAIGAAMEEDLKPSTTNIAIISNENKKFRTLNSEEKQKFF